MTGRGGETSGCEATAELQSRVKIRVADTGSLRSHAANETCQAPDASAVNVPRPGDA